MDLCSFDTQALGESGGTTGQFRRLSQHFTMKRFLAHDQDCCASELFIATA